MGNLVLIAYLTTHSGAGGYVLKGPTDTLIVFEGEKFLLQKGRAVTLGEYDMYKLLTSEEYGGKIKTLTGDLAVLGDGGRIKGNLFIEGTQNSALSPITISALSETYLLSRERKLIMELSIP